MYNRYKLLTSIGKKKKKIEEYIYKNFTHNKG